MSLIHKVLSPSIYHGHNKKPPFFEGWYYKLVSASQEHKFAIIPGIFLGNNGYAFIQLLDGSTGKSDFFTYPINQFIANEDHFDLKIGNSHFCLDSISLDVQAQGKTVQAELNFETVTGWPVSIFSPGIMGWYAWVPKMECYHAVLGFDHKISGNLNINSKIYDLSKGRGYIEKDWGQAFPQGYVWMQSNHFQQTGICLTASVAMIPWLGHEFRGYIIGLWIEGTLYKFATYTGAQLIDLKISEQKVSLEILDRKHKLEIVANRNHTGLLKGPTRNAMDMRVAESLTSSLDVRLTTTQNELIFEGTGLHAGLEIAGDIPRLLTA